MIIPRRAGHIEVIHPNGKVGLMVHPLGPITNELVYVHVTPYASANWARAECTFRYRTEIRSINR